MGSDQIPKPINSKWTDSTILWDVQITHPSTYRIHKRTWETIMPIHQNLHRLKRYCISKQIMKEFGETKFYKMTTLVPIKSNIPKIFKLQWKIKKMEEREERVRAIGFGKDDDLVGRDGLLDKGRSILRRRGWYPREGCSYCYYQQW